MKRPQSRFAAAQTRKVGPIGDVPKPLARPGSTSKPPTFRCRDLMWIVFLVVVLAITFTSRNSFLGSQADLEDINSSYRDGPTTPFSDPEVLRAPPARPTAKQPPRILRYNVDTNEVEQLTNDFTYQHRHVQLTYKKRPSELWSKFEKRKQVVEVHACVPMHDWQTARFLSCNSIHEMQMGQIEFINCGGSRCAFKFFDIDGKPQVVKTQL
jgi:hypothetical protein